MPMLHGCAFPGCSTFTLSTYCVEHELLVRAVKESERTHGASIERVEDAALSADPAGETQAPAPL
jgi:phage terminase small subunit